MIPNICHIYGPLYLNNYGLCIFLGILAFTFISLKDSLRKQFIPHETFINLVAWGTLVGILGGRLFFIFTNLSSFDSFLEYFLIWEGGLSILGSVIAITLFLPLYLRLHNVPIIPILDLTAIYAPLLIGISRFGCFFAGCCHGKASNLPWALTYTHPDSMAPLYKSLHPTQLYSAAFYLSFFVIMYFIIRPYFTNRGQLFGIFLMIIGAERALLDCLRGDQELFSFMSALTIAQITGLTLFICGAILFILRMRLLTPIKRTHESI